MFTNGIHHDLAMIGHGIHFYLFGMFDELTDYHRMLLADVGRQLKETFQLFLVGADIHRRTTQHITRANQYREAYLLHECIDIIHRRKLFPTRLVYSDAVEHGGELLAVFGIVDTLCGCSEDIYVLFVQAHRQVVRYLSSGRDDHAVRIFEFEDVHHAFEGQFVEVETVAHIVIGRNRFRVIVDHHRAPTLLANRVQRLHAAPVELYRATDTVSTRTEHHNRTFVAQILHIVFRSAVSQIQVVGLCRIFGGEGIDLFHYRKDATIFTILAHLQDGSFAVFHFILEDGAGNLEVRETLHLSQTEQVVGYIGYLAEAFQGSGSLDDII